MNDYYVYVYWRLDTNEPFYVGKGRDRRWKCLYPSRRNEHFIRIIEKHPIAVEIVKDKLYYARTKPINLPINFTTLHHFSANAHIKGSTYGAAFVAPYVQENRTDQVVIDVLGSKSTGDIEYTMYVYGSM